MAPNGPLSPQRAARSRRQAGRNCLQTKNPLRHRAGRTPPRGDGCLYKPTIARVRWGRAAMSRSACVIPRALS